MQDDKFDKLDPGIQQAIKDVDSNIQYWAKKWNGAKKEVLCDDIQNVLMEQITCVYRNDSDRDSLFQIYESLRGRKDITITEDGLKHSSGLRIKADVDSSRYVNIWTPESYCYELSAITETINKFCDDLNNIVSLYGSFDNFMQKQVDRIHEKVCKAQLINQVIRQNTVAQFDDIWAEIDDYKRRDRHISCDSSYNIRDNDLLLIFKNGSSARSIINMNFPSRFQNGEGVSQDIEAFRKDLLNVCKKYVNFLEKYDCLY